MPKITYNTRLILNIEDQVKLQNLLEAQCFAYNECSKIKFTIPKNSIVELHASFYSRFRKNYPHIPSQVVISAQRECLAAYRGITSNKHKISKSITKKRLSMRLDKNGYSYKNGIFSIISLEKRVKCSPYIYPKLQKLINKYRFCDPLLFERNGEIWISMTFDIPELKPVTNSVCGIDLGIRMAAVTSEGKFYQDKKFNGEKRKLRFLKSKLQSKGTKSAQKHLKKLRRKEYNKNKNQSHLLANRILQDTKSDVITIENLTGIKKKKHKYQNKNAISQVPFYQLRQFLTYKAPIFGKTVIQVNPRYTSQLDHRTGKLDGIRQGRRYYGADGVVLDADQNAAINIALRSKLPASYVTVLDGQAIVTSPNVH